jgi:hypothetical protein
MTLLAASCGGSSDPDTFPEDAVPVWVNRDLSVARERLLVAVVELDGTRLGDPEKPVTLEVAPQDDLAAVQSSAAGFTWTVPEAIGFYRADFDFDRAGVWEVTVVPQHGEPLDTILIQVRDNECRREDAAAPCAPRVGEQAPSLATPTVADQPVEALTTDPDPDPRLYQLSLDALVDNGRPGVVIFATPAYCQTAACGPIVQNIKPVIDEYPGVDFLHIEVYTGLLESDFAPDIAHLSPALIAWSLPTEPWVFVVDESGVVTARFEGALGADELRAHL